MTLNEYRITAHGYFLRHDRSKEAIRKLYVLTYNSLVKKGKEISSEQAIYRHWPLLTDPRITDILDKAEMESRMKRAQEFTAAQKALKYVNNNAESRN